MRRQPRLLRRQHGFDFVRGVCRAIDAYKHRRRSPAFAVNDVAQHLPRCGTDRLDIGV